MQNVADPRLRPRDLLDPAVAEPALLRPLWQPLPDADVTRARLGRRACGGVPVEA